MDPTHVAKYKIGTDAFRDKKTGGSGRRHLGASNTLYLGLFRAVWGEIGSVFGGGPKFLRYTISKSKNGGKMKKSIFRPKSKVVRRCEIWFLGVEKRALAVPGNDFWPPTRHHHL